MASSGHPENRLSDEPVKNQAAAEDETGNDSDGVNTCKPHQEVANNREIDHRFSKSEPSEEIITFSTTARWRQRDAWARALEESCKDLSLCAKEEIIQELDKDSSCSKAECENKLCMLRRELRTSIQEFYAISSSSVAGVEVVPQVEVGSQGELGPEVEGGPQDSAEIIALMEALAASKARLAAGLAASSARLAASKFTIEVFRIFKEHDRVKNVLGGVSRGSNETHFTIGTLRSKQQELALAVSLDATRFESTRAPSPNAEDELIPNCPSFKIEQVNGQSPHDLSAFFDFLQNLLKKSKVPSNDYQSGQYSSHIQETTEAIVNWKIDTNGSVPALYKPSWKGCETRGAHPILCAIMWKIACMCNDKKHFVCEQYVPREDTHPPRFVDIDISDVVEFMKAKIPALLDVPLEIKPTAREKLPLAKMLEQGESQAAGHLAKILIDAFHLWGIGIDRVVRGVVMTIVSVEIVEMTLSGMGTAEVKLEMRKTGHAPLFDMDTTLNLLGDMKDKSCVVKNCLKPFAEGDSPQEGFILLQNLLSGLLEHHGPTSLTYSNRTGDTSIPLGGLLGSGAFSSAYALKEHAETFLKTPKSRRCVKVLKNEAEALKALDHTCIPKVFLEDAPHLGVLTVQFLCNKSELPSLRLKGLIGTPASKINVKNLNQGDLQHIVEGVTSALEHAHARGWVHLDVRPSNIIVGQMGYVSPRVQLIDFGCAAQKNVVLSQFRGCPPFAHSDLLCEGLEKWLPDDKHDMASLSFTIASLLAGSFLPWFEFNGCNITPDRLKERSNIVTELLCESNNKLNEATRIFLIESIDGSLVELQKRPQKRRWEK